MGRAVDIPVGIYLVIMTCTVKIPLICLNLLAYLLSRNEYLKISY